MKAQKTTQYERVKEVMCWASGAWLTLWQIQSVSHVRNHVLDSEAAISARLRDLRKNGYTVEKRKRKGSRAWEYRLVV